MIDIRLIADFIEANTSFTTGINLFVTFWTQENPDRAVLIKLNGGNEDVELRIHSEIMLQVLTRAVSWLDSQNDISEMHNALYKNGFSHADLPAVNPEFQIEGIIPTNAPQYVGQDEKGRHQYSVNYKTNTYLI